MTTKATHGVKVGDIFVTRFSSFYQVVKATAKTVTVRPIEGKFVGCADEFGWEKMYQPLPGTFCENGYWPREVCESGKRCTVRDFTVARVRPQIKITDYQDAWLWDGTPGVLDTYS